MGSLYLPRLSEQDVVDRYLAGESRGLLGLRAKKSDAWVVSCLTRAGVPLRSPTEAMAIMMRNRTETQMRQRGKRVVVFPPGTTGRRRPS
jgi:hypothetical protein